jgi:glycosyltransferase involved in cell wall biosynthesis
MGDRALEMLLVPAEPWGPNWAAFSPGKAPDPVHIFDLMAERGIRTTLLDPSGRPWNPLSGRPVYEGLDPSRALRVLFRERHCDVVLASFETPAIPLLAARGLLRFKPLIAAVDIGLAEVWHMRERMLDFAIPRLDAIFLLSSNQADYIRRQYSTHAFIQYIPQHVDTSFYRPEPTPPDAPILSVGFDRGRDFQSLLQAVRGLDVPVVIKARLDIGPSEHPNVRVIREFLPATGFKALFRDSRFVVVPLLSSIHSSGIGTVLEAMAMGKALIVSDSPGIRDYAIHEETCLTVPCGDPVALRQAITRLLSEPETCRRLGSNGRKFVEKYCSQPVYAKNLADAIETLVATRAKRH